MTYRVYVTDCLKAIGHLDGKRYIEVVTDRLKPAKREKRTEKEIVNKIRQEIRKCKEG